jgi:hypothetical protein
MKDSLDRVVASTQVRNFRLEAAARSFSLSDSPVARNTV